MKKNKKLVPPRSTIPMSPSQPSLDAEFASQLEQAKLDAMKELAYGASHEINNPLANISTRAQTLLKTESDPERRRMLAAIHQQAMRAHEMIADLMLFARPPQMEVSRFDLAMLCERVRQEFAGQATDQGIEIAFNKPSMPVPIEADETQLAVAIRAVVQNSFEAIGTNGHVEIVLTAAEDVTTLTVEDDGPGIPPDARPHIFEPFYSGREAGRGLGFGLAKCWRIVTEHAGTIDVASSAAGGTTVTIRLPQVARGNNAH